MAATKTQLIKAINQKGYCWVIRNKGDREFEVLAFDDISSDAFDGYVTSNRAFLSKGAAASTVRLLKEVFKQSKKD